MKNSCLSPLPPFLIRTYIERERDLCMCSLFINLKVYMCFDNPGSLSNGSGMTMTMFLFYITRKKHYSPWIQI